jgi:hypothetical protein
VLKALRRVNLSAGGHYSSFAPFCVSLRFLRYSSFPRRANGGRTRIDRCPSLAQARIKPQKRKNAQSIRAAEEYWADRGEIVQK